MISFCLNTFKISVFEYGVSKKNYNRIFVWGHTKTGALGIPYIRTTEKFDLIKDFRNPKRMGFGEKNEVNTSFYTIQCIL